MSTIFALLLLFVACGLVAAVGSMLFAAAYFIWGAREAILQNMLDKLKHDKRR